MANVAIVQAKPSKMSINKYFPEIVSNHTVTNFSLTDNPDLKKGARKSAVSWARNASAKARTSMAPAYAASILLATRRRRIGGFWPWRCKGRMAGAVTATRGLGWRRGRSTRS